MGSKYTHLNTTIEKPASTTKKDYLDTYLDPEAFEAFNPKLPKFLYKLHEYKEFSDADLEKVIPWLSEKGDLA